MKIWTTPEKNWVLELEEKEGELIRLLYPLGLGMQEYKKKRGESELSRCCWIMTALIRRAIDTQVIGCNYTQDYPTVDEPYVTDIEKQIKYIVAVWDETEWSSNGFDEEDIKLMREIIKTGEYERLT